MHILLLEKGYAESVWGRQTLQGLTGELKKRREDFFTAYSAQGISPEDTVFVIGSIVSWLSETIHRCNAIGVTPILLCSSMQQIPGGKYHCVCSDVEGSTRQLTAFLKQTCGARIALYGINPNSAGDRSRVDAFLLENPCPGAVYENTGSLEECFFRFLPDAQQYDAVICANGFAAVSLVKRLQALSPDTLSRLRIINCSQTMISQYRNEHLISADMNLGRLGKTALSIADLVRKQPHISGITARVTWSIEDLPGWDTLLLSPVPIDEASDEFYSDDELQQMLRLDELLSSSDDIDKTLLSELLAGESYAHMADVCFLTEGGVKYRIRKMRELCGVADRDALAALLRKYIT